jgi:predicted ABC-type ATPase
MAPAKLLSRWSIPNEAACTIFVNADLIAEGLSPLAPEIVAVRAGRLMLEEIRRHANIGNSFAFETTLAGKRYAQLIPYWRGKEYRVHLIFLRLE